MKKKIYYALSIVLLIAVGATTYLLTRPKKHESGSRDFIVARVDNDNAYPFEMTFPKGTPLYEIAWVMHLPGGEMQRKSGTNWLPIDSTQEIYEDIYFKVS